MHHPTDRIAHTTAFDTPVVEHWLEREIAQWVHPMKDRPDDPSHHERTLLPRSYISLRIGMESTGRWSNGLGSLNPKCYYGYQGMRVSVCVFLLCGGLSTLFTHTPGSATEPGSLILLTSNRSCRQTSH